MSDPEEQALREAVVEATLAYDAMSANDGQTVKNQLTYRYRRAISALRDHRAKSAPVPEPRCEPPEEFRRERWHWLKNTGEARPVWWAANLWQLHQSFFSPEEATEKGWRYHSPARPDTRRDLDREERAHLDTIDECDHRTGQIYAIYRALGGEHEWSNNHDLGDEALELAQELMLATERPDTREAPTDEAFEKFVIDYFSGGREIGHGGHFPVWEICRDAHSHFHPPAQPAVEISEKEIRDLACIHCSQFDVTGGERFSFQGAALYEFARALITLARKP